jgi:phage terminase large subunit-like protein
LRAFLYSEDDLTLQAHRGSYKTTTLSLFFALHTVVFPDENILYFRKTGGDVTEIARQTINMLHTGCFQEITGALYNKELKLLRESSSEITTNLVSSIKGSSQIVGLGLGTSITGKHSDIVVTDDIVNVNDRISAAERERTKVAYMEMQNIKNRGGRFINTGTPWHKDDCFTLMPNPTRYDCYNTGLMSEADIEGVKSKMSPSLFSANYELRHIASEDIIFTERPIGASVEFIRDAFCHLDSAFYGEDYTAFTAMKYLDGKFYIYGKVWRKNVQDCYQTIYYDYLRLMLGKCFNEKNADKGMVARDLKKMGMRMVTYDETTNKHIKIVTYLKAIWSRVIFVEGTDPEYIEQILDYNENAKHDDAPDSAACLARRLYRKAGIEVGVNLGTVKEEET